MTRVLINDCHLRLHKYRAVIEQERTECATLFGELVTDSLGRTISILAKRRQELKRMSLEQKFGKLKPEYKTNENVVRNLSSRQLTEQELRVLSREANFNTADAKPAEFIAALEAMLVRTNATDEAKHTVRQKVTSLLLTNRPINNMSPAEIEAMKELKMDKDIIVLPADKGRATVVMNRVDYNEKAQALLDDQQSYKSTPPSRAKSMIGQLTGLLNRLKRNSAISLDEWRQMKPTDTALARFYGLPKIHKPNVPLRPIVALKGSPTYNLSKWMARKLNFLREGSRTSINSASQFLADIRGKVVRPDQIMVSFDVVSLFTSIPPDLARDVLRKRLEENYDETNRPLKIDHLLQLFAFCQQTYFTFNGRTYEQIKGTPMGSPISSLVAELVLQELEKVAFDHYEPAFWRRYVDDTFVIIERSRLADFQDLLNGIFPDIQFTREEEHDEQLPFLDVLVTRTPNGELNTTVYRKATNTTQILNYHSNHPMAHKRSCVRTLFQRVKTHCSEPEGRVRELRHLRDQLARNGYPNSFVSRCLRTRPRRTNGGEPPTLWHPLPYIKNVSEAMERIAGELGVGIAHRPTATMRNKIIRVKDRLDVGEQSGVVYQIPCRDCPRHYTGQTGRRLSSRITEHKRAVRRGDPLSQVATHTLEEGHEFNFASTRIVARANNKTGRELLEAWVSDTNSINRHVDIPPCYHALRSRGQEARPNFQPRVHAVTPP
ncbi:hypothetical protein SprV_0401651300 [Sparganum proliferum]